MSMVVPVVARRQNMHVGAGVRSWVLQPHTFVLVLLKGSGGEDLHHLQVLALFCALQRLHAGLAEQLAKHVQLGVVDRSKDCLA